MVSHIDANLLSALTDSKSVYSNVRIMLQTLVETRSFQRWFRLKVYIKSNKKMS